MRDFNRELSEVRRKRDDAADAAETRGDDPYAAGIRVALEHGIPDLERNLPRLRELLGDVDAKSFALGALVTGFLVNGVDIFAIASMPQFEEIRRYLERIKDL